MEPSESDKPKRTDPIDVWKDLVTKEQLSREREIELTDDEKRTLAIRKASLRIADCLDSLLHDPEIPEDAAKQATVLVEYWDNMRLINEAGVIHNMHVGDPPESFDNPKKVAEYVAGQLFDTKDKDVPSESGVMPEIMESSETEIPFQGSNPSEQRTAALIPTEYLTPKVKDFIIMRSIVNLTHSFLASDLDKPLPKKSP